MFKFKKEKQNPHHHHCYRHRRRFRPLPRWHAIGGPLTSSSPNVHPSRRSIATSHFRLPTVRLVGEAIAPVGGG